MRCPRCGKFMHEVDAGLWTCPCGASLRFEVSEQPKRKRKPKPKPLEPPVPSRCMLECPEKHRCDLVETPTRCLTFKAVRIKHMSISK